VDTRLDVPDGLAVAVGANGAGKTNLLEAMHYGLALASPRSSSDQPLIRGGAPAAYVRCEVESAGGRALVEVEIRAAGANRVQVNRSGLRRRRDIRRVARAVFFGPADLDVVQGGAEARRGFMDEVVATGWPRREPLAAVYERVLRQRNRLLKEWEGGGEPSGLAAWDAELVSAGAALTAARAAAVEALAPLASEEFRSLTGYPLEAAYTPSVPTGRGAAAEELEAAFRSRLAERRADELVRRVTLVGPHRDDLSLAVRDMTARTFASHGEAWAAALSLRLGQAAAVASEMGEPPVLLLDDPFPGLDPVRQGRLTGRVTGRGQTVLSVADRSHVPAGAAVVWEVHDGAVRTLADGGETTSAVDQTGGGG
jgi:DNA replication and repair protein RecF